MSPIDCSSRSGSSRAEIVNGVGSNRSTNCGVQSNSCCSAAGTRIGPAGTGGGSGGRRRTAYIRARIEPDPEKPPEPRQAPVAPRKLPRLNFDSMEVPDVPTDTEILFGLFLPDEIGQASGTETGVQRGVLVTGFTRYHASDTIHPLRGRRSEALPDNLC